MKQFDIKIVVNNIEIRPLRNAAETLQDLKGIMGLDPYQEFVRIFISELTERRELFAELINIAELEDSNESKK